MKRAIAGALALSCLGGPAAAQVLQYTITEPSSHFGLFVVGTPDVDGDQVPDILAGTHRFHQVNGQVGMYSGADGSEIWEHTGNDLGLVQLGYSVGCVGDVDLDGTPDVAAMTGSGVHVFDGADGSVLYSAPAAFMFRELPGLGDTNGDGHPDYLIDNEIHSGVDGSVLLELAVPDEVEDADGLGDVDGDGLGDMVVPSAVGADVYSGATGNLIYDVPNGASEFFIELAALGDVDGDTVTDWAGGLVAETRIYSGADGSLLGTIPDGGDTSGAGDVDGDGTPDVLITTGSQAQVWSAAGIRLLAAKPPSGFIGAFGWTGDGIGDVTGDGLDDFAVGAPFGLPSGTGDILVYSSECAQPESYCTAKASTSGCLASVSTSGLPDGSVPFSIDATGVENFKPGLLFYGYGPAALSFQGGTLCVAPPLRRTLIQFSAGTFPVDCTGSFSFDMGAQITSGTDPFLVPAAPVHAQYWFRDPLDAFGIGLSDATRFQVCP